MIPPSVVARLPIARSAVAVYDDTMTHDGTDAGALWQGWLATFREATRRAYVAGEIDRDAFDDASAALEHVRHRTDAPNARRATYRELRECGVPADRLTVRTFGDPGEPEDPGTRSPTDSQSGLRSDDGTDRP